MNKPILEIKDLLQEGVILRDGQGNEFAVSNKKSNNGTLSRELGAGGVSYFRGYIESDEFNEDLTGPEGVKTYDKMRRTDAQVAGILNACKLPLLSAEYDIGRPEDEEQADNITDEHLDFAKDNLFTRINFDSFLRHTLSALWAGFSWFEKVYKIENQKKQLAKLSPRMATTLEKWLTDDEGNLTGVQQHVYKNGRYQDIEIPRDKIALFTYQQEANNFEGLSLLRPLYKHFFIKDTIYRIDAIRHERFAIGVPVITVPDAADKDAIAYAKQIGKNWKGAEQSYVVIFPEWNIEILQVHGSESLDVIPTIQHHNEEMAKSILAQFINFGTTQTGSRALGVSAQEFFFDALQGVADWICATIDNEILWPLMDLNFQGEIRPQTTASDLGSISLDEVVRALREIGDMYITPDFDTENYLRDKLSLPLREEEEDLTPIEATAVHRHFQAPPSEQSQADEGFWRELTPVERHMALRQIEGKLEDTKARIARMLLSVRDKWGEELGNQFADAIPEGPAAITKVVIPNSEIRNTVRKILPVLRDIYDFGAQQVKNELESQAEEAGISLKIGRTHETTIVSRQGNLYRDDPIETAEINELLRVRANVMVTRLKRKTEEAAWAIAIDKWRTVGSDITNMDIDEVVERVMASVEQESKLAASFSASETMNLGRDFTAQRMEENIRVAQYSAILDERTCPQCRSADFFEAKVGTDAYYDVIPPLASNQFGQCDGLTRCRCIWTYILKMETTGGV